MGKKAGIIILTVLMQLFFAFSSSAQYTNQSDSIVSLLEKFSVTQGAYCRRLVGELYALSDAYPENKQLLANAIYWESNLGLIQGDSDSTLIQRINLNLEQFTDSDYSPEKALLIYSRFIVHLNQNNFAFAFQDGINSLERFRQLKNKKLTVQNLIYLGNLCPYINNYNLAYSYYEEGLTMVEPTEREYFQILINKYRMHSMDGKNDIVVHSLEQLRKSIEQSNVQDTGLLVAVYLNLGISYSESGDYNKGFEYCTYVLKTFDEIDNNSIAVGLYQNLGKHHLMFQQYDSAKHYLVKAQEIASRNNRPDQLVYVYGAFYKIYAQLEDTDSALYYLLQYTMLNEQLTNNPQTMEVYHSYISMLLEAAQKNLLIAEQELFIKRKQVVQSIIMFITIMLVIVFFLILSIQKRRNMKQKAHIKEMENKDLSERLAQEQKIKELQNEKLELQLRETTSFSLLISYNKHTLSDIWKHVQLLSGDHDAETISRLKKIIQSNLAVENDWEDFVMHFEQVHPRFFDNLQSRYPDLTQNDLKLCAYCRIGLSLKEVARILNISPDSVKKNRYRLRKKLLLKDDENLDDFIANLSFS